MILMTDERKIRFLFVPKFGSMGKKGTPKKKKERNRE